MTSVKIENDVESSEIPEVVVKKRYFTTDDIISDQSKVLNIINDFKITPCLWDPDDGQFSNFHERQDVINNFAKKYQCSDQSIRYIWKKLSDNFMRRYQSRYLGIKQSKWYPYDSMKFLIPVIRGKLELPSGENSNGSDGHSESEKEMDELDPQSTKVWNPSQFSTMRLIEDYKKESPLWNRNDPLFKNPDIREARWEKLAAKYKRTAVEVRRKIISLRNYFHRRHAETKRGIEPKWYAYNALMFTLGQCDNGVDEDGPTYNVEFCPALPEKIISISDIKVERIGSESPPPTKKICQEIVTEVADSPDTGAKQPDDATYDEDVLCNPLWRGKTPDKYSYFGELMATKLRKINNPRVRAMAMQKINTTMFELEMEYLGKVQP